MWFLRGAAGGPAGWFAAWFCVVQLVARLGRYWAGEGDDGVVGPARKAGLKAGWPQTGRPEASPNRQATSQQAQSRQIS
ncbi:hypothetical protein CJ186_04830 [Actinomyces graevenitzii]|nr:hypothetical protein CJ186_04830 [Actinomyces graevenitzii]